MGAGAAMEAFSSATLTANNVSTGAGAILEAIGGAV